MSKTIIVTNIRGKSITRRGVKHPAPVAYHHNAEIVPGVSIRLYGIDTNHVDGDKPYDITFKVGDQAEFDSYNLSYVGKILAITEKTVTIEGHSRPCRLDIYEFDHRNHDFDLAAINERNNVVSQTI